MALNMLGSWSKVHNSFEFPLRASLISTPLCLKKGKFNFGEWRSELVLSDQLVLELESSFLLQAICTTSDSNAISCSHQKANCLRISLKIRIHFNPSGFVPMDNLCFPIYGRGSRTSLAITQHFHCCIVVLPFCINQLDQYGRRGSGQFGCLCISTQPVCLSIALYRSLNMPCSKWDGYLCWSQLSCTLADASCFPGVGILKASDHRS